MQRLVTNNCNCSQTVMEMISMSLPMFVNAAKVKLSMGIRLLTCMYMFNICMYLMKVYIFNNNIYIYIYLFVCYCLQVVCEQRSERLF